MAKQKQISFVATNKNCCDESFVQKMIRLGLLQNPEPPNLNFILCENLNFLVQENGDKLKLENSL